MLMLQDFRVRQRDFLLDISRALTAQLDLGEVLRLVLNASVVMVSGDVGLIALREETGFYRIRATLGIATEHTPLLNQHLQGLITSANGVHDQAALNQQMKQMAQAIDARLRQSIAMPLLFGGSPLGMLIVFRAYRGNATADDMQVLQSFADQAAIAVHNAQLYASIDQERQRMSVVLDHSADGVMILDAEARIVMFNRALERMTGWVVGDAAGLKHDNVFTWSRRDGEGLTQAMARGWPITTMPTLPPSATLFSSYDAPATPPVLDVQGDLQRKDGGVLSVGITYVPVLSRAGRLTSLIANVRDISQFTQAQEMQNIFISTISHELRTPITLVKGYAGTLRRDDVAWDTQVVRESLTVIEEETDRLSSLVENLLTATRLQARRGLDLALDEANLVELAQRVVERFGTQTDHHALALNFSADFPIVQADVARIRQVLDNLISNAIKYSPEGGTIEVGGYTQGDGVVLYVQDQGIGLSEDERRHLFQRFYRAHTAVSRNFEGTGLGLYLSRAIVEAHQGRIDVVSQPGQGSTFRVHLPVTPTAPRAALL